MTGLVRRTGGSVRRIRTSIEVVVVIAGWLLGGTLGPATVVYALAVGPLVHTLLPRLTVAQRAQSMQVRAAGRTASRSGAIGLPQDSQTP